MRVAGWGLPWVPWRICGWGGKATLFLQSRTPKFPEEPFSRGVMMRGLAVLWILSCIPVGIVGQRQIAFGGRTWTSTASDAKVEYYLGREALRLRNGSVFLDDVEFESGIIEYDMATTGHRSFVGAVFRRSETAPVGYEEFYLRPHQTGRFDAVQYTPSYNGISAWHLYPEYNAPVHIPRNEWIHVKLVIAGSHMDVFVADMTTPVLVVHHLRRGPGPGRVGLTANFPGAQATDIYPTAFANVSVRVDDGLVNWAEDVAPSVSTGIIGAWSLSRAVAATPGPVEMLDESIMAASGWRVVHTDSTGRLNIAAHTGFPRGAQQGTVFARVTIRSDRAQVKKLNFGFSDRASVFLNGHLLFTGNNTYRSRSLRYLGAMTLNNDAIYLNLREGENELVFAVSEAFGGWGLVARLGDMRDVSISAGTR